MRHEKNKEEGEKGKIGEKTRKRRGCPKGKFYTNVFIW